MDKRTLRKTGRTEQFATRVRKEWLKRVKDIAKREDLKLVEVLEESTEGVSQEDLERRLTNASEGLKLLLMAWARYEDEQPDGRLKTSAQEARQDWGRIARQFLHEE